MLIYGRESKVTTKKILSKEQTDEMGYLRRVLGVTFRDIKHRHEIRKPRDVKPLPNRENPAMLVRPCVQNVPGKNGERSPSGYNLHLRESDPEVLQGPGSVTTSPTLLGPVLVWRQQNYLRLLLIVR